MTIEECVKAIFENYQRGGPYTLRDEVTHSLREFGEELAKLADVRHCNKSFCEMCRMADGIAAAIRERLK